MDIMHRVYLLQQIQPEYYYYKTQSAPTLSADTVSQVENSTVDFMWQVTVTVQAH